MRIKLSTARCSYCKDILGNWDYRFQGKHYCRICYDRFFELTQCIKCHKEKKIFIFLSNRICKTCLVKDIPCIRCGKVGYSHGLISRYGPVCNSCSIYFREYKKCTSCEKESYDIYNRTILDGSTKQLCTNCYNKTLPLCYRCHRNTKPYKSIEGKNICEKCATQEDRICTQCQLPFPAGRGRICKDCSYANILKRKTKVYATILSPYTSSLFQEFSKWLKKRRKVLYASLHLQNYYPFFQELDDVAKELGKFPTYTEMVQYLTVAKTRKYLLVTIFLNEKNEIHIDKAIQEEYANLDMIDKLLRYFPKEENRYTILFNYYSMLNQKSFKNKTSIRSIRLALTPAAKFLKYCEHFQNKEISNYSLSGYLWVYRGQTSAIYGFITFLNKQYSFSLNAHRTPSTMCSPRYTKRQLKQKLITLLKNPQYEQKNQQLLRIALGYIHHIDLPDNAFIHHKDIKKDKDETCYLRLHGKKFYLPIEVTHIILKPKETND